MRAELIDYFLIHGFHKSIIFMSQDAGLGVFCKFKTIHPQNFMNMGISEQSSASIAAGMAILGDRPILYNIAPFILMRAFEQIRNDICYQNLPVVLIGTGAPLCYSQEGISHITPDDIGLIKALPNIQCYSPSDLTELNFIAKKISNIKYSYPIYLRLPKSVPNKLDTSSILAEESGVRVVFKSGDEIALCGYGALLPELIAAAHLLTSKGLGVKVLSLFKVLPVPLHEMALHLTDTRHVFFLEEQFAGTGISDVIALEVAKLKKNLFTRTLCLPSSLPIQPTQEIRHLSGLTAQKVASWVLDLQATQCLH